MKTEISNEISRLELHDSSFETITRHDNEIKITFDWSKLENLKEQNIAEPIIIGKTTMFLTGLNSEEFKVFEDNDIKKISTIPVPDDIIEGIENIGANEIDDNNKKIKISGLYNKNGKLKWVEWSFHFDTCKVSWSSHITYTEWLNGKLPKD